MYLDEIDTNDLPPKLKSELIAPYNATAGSLSVLEAIQYDKCQIDFSSYKMDPRAEVNKSTCKIYR
ncbi:hypothetical protein [Piscirickettsia litoralis]|uniref:Uncharacterized protein n=1 Tax=Piscirickettsia litoralis TaxID=1891921 RepID=A0ABX3A3H8_9GAMM|nr:hypothetical protein [Piscirickettsia litoralis]ODN43429.1 hypothetical protein BGC07_11490 [Piscirickettsia litoralis]